jgi:hypothetical protein
MEDDASPLTEEESIAHAIDIKKMHKKFVGLNPIEKILQRNFL